MGWKFFDKQRIDTAGVLAVRLEKLLIIFFVLSWFDVGANVFFMMQGSGFNLFPFIFIGIAWFVWFLGWKGATERKPCCLMAYFVLTLIGAIFQVIGFFVTSVGGSLFTILLLNQCATDNECAHNVDAKSLLKEYPWIITAIFAISIVIYIIPLFLNVIGLFLSMAIRKELLVLKRAETLSLQEEGNCNTAKTDCVKMEQEQEPQQQQPDMGVPIFYAMPQQQNMSFVPQYMPLQVAGNNGAPTVVFVPYPQDETVQQ